MLLVLFLILQLESCLRDGFPCLGGLSLADYGSFAALTGGSEELVVCHDNVFLGSHRCHKPRVQ